MNILKIAGVAIVAAVLSLIVKQIKPEYTMLIQTAGAGAIFLILIELASELMETAASAAGAGGISDTAIRIMLKVLGVALVTSVASDICKDSGSESLAGAAETAGKLLILAMTLPMLASVAEAAIGLIK